MRGILLPVSIFAFLCVLPMHAHGEGTVLQVGKVYPFKEMALCDSLWAVYRLKQVRIRHGPKAFANELIRIAKHFNPNTGMRRCALWKSGRAVLLRTHGSFRINGKSVTIVKLFHPAFKVPLYSWVSNTVLTPDQYFRKVTYPAIKEFINGGKFRANPAVPSRELPHKKNLPMM